MAQMKYFYELTISSSPHAHSPITTQTIMRDVLIALAPALLGSIYFFGFRALTVTLVSVCACVFFEWAYCRLTHKHCKIYDLSACVTGVLLAYVCPVTIPYWTIILGDLFAIVLVKMLFGGLGHNIVNPALAGRAFLFSWPVLMSTWVKVGFENAAGLISSADAVTAATPLANMHQGLMPDASIADLFFGNVGGCLGETSALLLLIGFVYLLYRNVITARIPLAYMGTVAVLAFLFPLGNDRIAWTAAQLFGGGLMLGAIFMATDYVTSPVTKLGQIVYGIGCGVLTILIRYFGGYNEGVSYAILVMNCCVVLLDRIGRPVKFGAPKKEAAK
ncbi:MAG TPA: RnfABCDGE type electron transport complex subunit D [Candidatus Faecousia intestinavium]|nr:RnfABCDGE type electron transport complex subunit D [Candidatus Faecousia intestinavium]